MKKKLPVLALFFASLLFMACAEEKDALEYVNKSYQDIYIYKTYSADHVLPFGEEYMGRVIKPFYRSGRFESHTDYIYPDYGKYDTLYTTVVSADTVSKYEWRMVRELNMILRRDTIPLNDTYLKSIRYRLVYE